MRPQKIIFCTKQSEWTKQLFNLPISSAFWLFFTLSFFLHIIIKYLSFRQTFFYNCFSVFLLIPLIQVLTALNMEYDNILSTDLSSTVSLYSSSQISQKLRCFKNTAFILGCFPDQNHCIDFYHLKDGVLHSLTQLHLSLVSTKGPLTQTLFIKFFFHYPVRSTSTAPF